MIEQIDRQEIFNRVQDMKKGNSPCYRNVYDTELCNWVGRELNIRLRDDLANLKRNTLGVLINRSLEKYYVSYKENK